MTLLAEMFTPNGPLARTLSGYESRAEQSTVAARIAAHLQNANPQSANRHSSSEQSSAPQSSAPQSSTQQSSTPRSSSRQGSGHLIIEAGTGTGKTLAYLAPLIAAGKKAVISTGTKTLQDQLAGKDLPLLAQALGRPIDFQVMKGRGNYLCLTRAEEYLRTPPLPGTPQREAYDLLRSWSANTDDGDRAGLPGLGDDVPWWREVSSTSEQCRGRNCAQFDRCHVTSIRRRAQAAELVIVNHHLYFADLILRARYPDAQTTILPEHDIVIFDEAHELDEIAAQHFGVQLSEHRIHELLQDISRALRTEPALVARFSRIAADIELRSRELFDALPYDDGRARLAQGYSKDVLVRRQHLDTLLAGLENELIASNLEDRGVLARRAMNIATDLAFCVDDVARASLVAEPTRNETTTYEPIVDGPIVDRPIVGGPIFDGPTVDGAQNDDAAPAATPFVRYTEVQGRSRALVARPVDVAGLFASHLKAPIAVFVSATLRVGESFSHYKSRLGLNDADELAVGSPFDYGSNAALYIPNDLPEPDAPDFTDAATSRIMELVRASNGGAFVLCTSHRMLQFVRSRIARDRLVLAQGDAPKAELIDRFRDDGNAVLLGTMTFWSGVDVAGRALRSVIIDKLPFASPSDPLVAARVAHMKSRGEDAFRGYQLPQAALLLRQGFGRLIRRGDDRGMVTILDRRITQKSYGRIFLKSLPACPRFGDWTLAEQFLQTL